MQEFGSNLGHVNRLLAVARALPPHRATVVVPHPALALPRVQGVLGRDTPVLQAPAFHAPGIAWPPKRPEVTLADVFHAIGYAQMEPLIGAAQAWRDLLDRVHPDLIVSDFASTIRIANASRVPVVAVADCFSIIPPGSACPPIMPEAADEPLSARHEAELLENARKVARRHGVSPPPTFGALFSGDVSFPIGVRLLDPYAARREGSQRLSISLPSIRCGPAYAARKGPAVFCYLWAEHPALNTVVSALNRMPVPSQIHIRGLDPAAVAAHCAPQVGVRTAEADFSEVLPQSRLFVHYGGGGACTAGLLAGTVQVTLPIVLEQSASAARLARAGCALAVWPEPRIHPDALANLFMAGLDNASLQEAAIARAAEVSALPSVDTLSEIAATCTRLLADRAMA